MKWSLIFAALMTTAVAADAEELPSRLEKLSTKTGVAIHGFGEVRAGQRLTSDPYEDDDTLREARFQLDLSRQVSDWTFQFRGDLVADESKEDIHDVDLERGEGFLDLRELSAFISPLDYMDLKLGRQILTWGTGDYLFINDLFPKDWQSFFLGRDDEYLKAPSDAAFASFFLENVNIDLVVTPRFDPDRYITGERLSYYNGRSRAGENDVMNPDVPDDWIRDYEVAARFYKTLGSYEVAGYLYDGYWKSPGGMNPNNGRPIFPELSVAGASGRGNLGPGIANIEIGYYDSEEDRDGDDPFINNSEIRWLVGYQQEMGTNLNVGLQYYVEWMMEYSDYVDHQMGGHNRDEFRQVVTLSLNKLLMDQNLRASLFAYYSPTDEDYYLRPQISYKYTDRIKLFGGVNWFGGKYEYTFFNQFEHNSNLFLGARYSF